MTPGLSHKYLKGRDADFANSGIAESVLASRRKRLEMGNRPPMQSPSTSKASHPSWETRETPGTLARCGHQQERRALALAQPVGAQGELRIGRSPFLDPQDREACLDQQVEIGGDGAVLLHDALGDPVGRARAFVEIAIEGPG